jgi:PKD repeat protein
MDPDYGDDENRAWDIEEGTQGAAFEDDEDGDSTQADWRVRGLPELGVNASHDIIEGYDFTGDMVTFTFDDNENPADGVLFEETTELDPEGNFFRPLEGEFDVEVDQFVTVSDGITTKTTYVAPVDVTVVDFVNDTITGIADPGAEVFVDGFDDLHHTVMADGSGAWFLDLAGEIDLAGPTIVVPDQRDEDNDRTFALWETPSTVEGHVLLDGESLAGVEVWLGPDSYTCTDDDGHFLFEEASMLDAAIHGANAATGPAVNAEAGCANAEFVDADGIPLLVAFHGDFDLWDGYEYIVFNVERAAALQTVVVEEFDGADWVPLDDVMVQAFDLNDPDFIAAYGSDPEPEAYRDIFENDLGRIDTTWTGVYLFSLPGSSELRYPAVTDVLVLAEAPYGMILGDQTGATEFTERDDGVYVGPVVLFRIGPPAITAIVGPDDPIAVDTEATIIATFTDPTVGDSHTATVEWGDGTTTDADVVFDDGDGTATGVHAYSEAGVYTVTVTVTDSGGLFDTEEFSYIVVYDSDGGFVTGGGWIDSPAGAYAADPTLEGRASFGFVSKYKKRAPVPTGNTEFQFQAGDLNFHSDVYDWLVIAGSRAQFKGTGSINGDGEFGFMLTAVDEALTPSADVDRFRIKIWDKATDEIVYDNQMDDEDRGAVSTGISGGSIVIHKAKKVKRN